MKIGLVSADDFHLFKIAEDVDQAVEEIIRFYKIFHSYRWVGQRMVIRLHAALTREAVMDLNSRFADLLQSGEITQGTALPEENNEPDLLELPRLVLTPHRDNFGKLRTLIDAINLR